MILEKCDENLGLIGGDVSFHRQEEFSGFGIQTGLRQIHIEREQVAVINIFDLFLVLRLGPLLSQAIDLESPGFRAPFTSRTIIQMQRDENMTVHPSGELHTSA